MSGHSGSTNCPNCGASCDQYTDWKPYDYTIINCSNCGLTIGPRIEYMDLEELNTLREEQDLDPLDKLPIQDFEG